MQELNREPVMRDMQLLHSDDDFYEALCEELNIAPARGRQIALALGERARAAAAR